MIADERSPLSRSVLRILDRALPFEDGPAPEIIMRHLRENLPEIDLPIAQAAKAARTVDPVLKPAIDTCATSRAELCILDVERLDPVMIDVDEGQIIELLQHKWLGS